MLQYSLVNATGSARGLRVAVVHEWLEHYAGSERVVEQMLALFPQADLFVIADFMPASERGFLNGRAVRTSFIQRLPLAKKHFRLYLQLLPLAIEQFDLSGYDLILSSSHAVAKGVITGPGQLHVSYVHSPMRYAWDLQAQYLRQSGLDRGIKGLYARWLLHYMRTWDVRTANGVDVFIANSNYIAERIYKVYRREAIVVPPPVDVDSFRPAGQRSGDAYIAASRFVPYKRMDLIVRAFAAMPDRRLIVIGDGPDRAAVSAIAEGCRNIELRAPVPHAELVALMQDAKAYIHAAEEDFGITMVEAQACGTPVIAYGRGGALDIISEPGRTGVLFADQTPESLVAAVNRFEQSQPPVTPEACRTNALRFSVTAFKTRLSGVIGEALAGARARETAHREAYALSA